MLAAFLVVGATCAAAGVKQNRLATAILIASFRSSRFMDGPLAEGWNFQFRAAGLGFQQAKLFRPVNSLAIRSNPAQITTAL